MLKIRKVIAFMMLIISFWSFKQYNTAVALGGRETSPFAQTIKNIKQLSATLIPTSFSEAELLEESPEFVPDVVLAYEYTGPENAKYSIQREVIKPHWSDCYACQVSGAMPESVEENRFWQDDS